jgi:hypothetical protein
MRHPDERRLSLPLCWEAMHRTMTLRLGVSREALRQASYPL